MKKGVLPSFRIRAYERSRNTVSILFLADGPISFENILNTFPLICIYLFECSIIVFFFGLVLIRIYQKRDKLDSRKLEIIASLQFRHWNARMESNV